MCFPTLKKTPSQLSTAYIDAIIYPSPLWGLFSNRKRRKGRAVVTMEATLNNETKQYIITGETNSKPNKNPENSYA
jgi:hypothetical protein